MLDASRRRRASGTTGQLKLYGMKAACDEIISTALERQHEPRKIVGEQARSIKYRMTIARLPPAKEIEGSFSIIALIGSARRGSTCGAALVGLVQTVRRCTPNRAQSVVIGTAIPSARRPS